MRLKDDKNIGQLTVNPGHRLFHAERLGTGAFAGGAGQILRCADACDDILALGIDQELAIIGVLASRRIAREGHACG